MSIFKCHSCGKIFTRKQMFQHHINCNVCGGSKSKYSICNRIFTRKSYLQRDIEYKLCKRIKTLDKYEHMTREELIEKLVNLEKNPPQQYDIYRSKLYFCDIYDYLILSI